MPTGDSNALRMFIGGLTVGLIIGVGAALPATRPPVGPEASASRSSPLPAAAQSRVQDMLAAGASHMRMENYDAAAAIYERVLIEFDCANHEARRGLKATAPDRLSVSLRNCRDSKRC